MLISEIEWHKLFEIVDTEEEWVRTEIIFDLIVIVEAVSPFIPFVMNFFFLRFWEKLDLFGI